MRCLFAFVVASLGGGCLATSVDTNFTPLQAARPAVAPAHVELVFSGHVDRPYVELGLTQLTTSTQVAFVPEPFPSQGELNDRLRALGASKGCDALLVHPTAYNHAVSVISAVCIAYR